MNRHSLHTRSFWARKPPRGLSRNRPHQASTVQNKLHWRKLTLYLRGCIVLWIFSHFKIYCAVDSWFSLFLYSTRSHGFSIIQARARWHITYFSENRKLNERRPSRASDLDQGIQLDTLGDPKWSNPDQWSKICLDRSSSKEPANPLWSWIHWFFCCTMIQTDLGSLIRIRITPKERSELPCRAPATRFWRQNRSLETQNGSYFSLLAY